MEESKVIMENSCRIDYDNLCGGNDFASLTNNYERKVITTLIWSAPNDVFRYYLKEAIFLQKKMDACKSDEEFEELLGQQIHLNLRFNNLKLSFENLINEKQQQGAGGGDNDATEKNLIASLCPIFFGDEEAAIDYVKEIKKRSKNTEKVEYTANLVNNTTISEMSCRRVLWKILYDNKLYTAKEANWNIGMSKNVKPQQTVKT